MAETRYSTLVLLLGSKIQFLHNISSFLYTTSSGRGGLRCSLSSISVLLLLQAKRYRRISARGCEGGWAVSVIFRLWQSGASLECVGLNEFTLLRQLVLRGGLVSFLLDFWQLSQDMVVISFE